MKQLIFSPLVNKVFCALLIFHAGCNTPSSHARLRDSLEAKLDSLVPPLLGKTKVPGISIAVLRNGQVEFVKGYGFADKSNYTPVTASTRFQIGSVSKTITAAAILKLAEDGKIKLDEPVENYLKSWHFSQSKYDNNKITIRMILSHTAGLSVAGYHGVYKPGDELPSLVESLNGYTGSDGGLQIINEPGNSFKYSSGGYTLLQLLIQDVTGISFAEYVQQKIFDPLKMKNTTYEWSKDLAKDVATPYNENGNPWRHYQFVESASGGVYTTAADLAKFLTIFFHQSRPDNFIQQESIHQMITPVNGTEGKYGMGCKIFPINKTQEVVMHDGANEGWRAAYYIHPPTGDGIVMLINSDMDGKMGAPIICTVFKRTQVDFSDLCNQLK